MLKETAMTDRYRILFRLLAALAVVTLLSVSAVRAADPAGPPGLQVLPSQYGFAELWSRLEKAVAANKMGIVARASASKGAAARGIEIPGNAVIMVYRNDFAVRMLEANVTAGIEAPLHFNVTEDAAGTASLSYRTPSAVFAPYGGAALAEMAKELDAIFARIAADAVGG
jgi:uncharacterized protein (DUF302 family)